MAKTAKRFLSYDEQIALLKEQGLIIRDKVQAKQTLADIGYYELVNGYKALFKERGSSRYREGTTFGDLLALYKFDENLRGVCFKYILRIEIKLRSALSYAFCAVHGASQGAYLDASNYSSDREDRQRIMRVIGELRAAMEDERTVYVAYQRENHGNIPLWVLFKALSLGTVVRFYRAAEHEVRRQCAAAFVDVRCNTLDRMLDVMLDFRNVCAHNNILYTCKSDESIPPMPALRGVAYDGDFRFAGNDLFALLVIFRYLLTPGDFARAKDAFSAVIAHLLKECDTIMEYELYLAMGFPANWKDL